MGIGLFHWSAVLVDCAIIIIYGHIFLRGALLSYVKCRVCGIFVKNTAK